MSDARRLKSRAGCMQCKQRKVKCDQKIPGCQQCLRQKLECPGYRKPLRWMNTSPKSKSATTATKNETYFYGKSAIGAPYSNLAAREGFVCLQPLGLPRQLHDESSLLIQHYFTRVCKIAGCFDSDISPFRIVPATMMSYSQPVSLLLRASSAAQLSVQHPQMRYRALLLQSAAFSAVRAEIANIQGSIVPDELMLSCIIAGLTSSWYDVNDLGVCHVLGSQILLSLWLTSKKRRLGYQQTFILGAYVYWLAISAFVTGDPKASFEFQEALREEVKGLEMCYGVLDDTNVPDSKRRVFPHPLTGFSVLTFIAVGKVGSLCRLAHSEAAQRRLRGMASYKALETKARSVEAELLDLFQPREANFEDPQDSQTTVDEILAVGEAYRCAGLLQLYMTFPQLLQQQSRGVSDGRNHLPETSLSVDANGQLAASGKGFTPSQHNWLGNLAFHILSILETLPPTSGTRVIQGLPVLIAATWFVDPVPSSTSFSHPRLPLRKSSRSKEEARAVVKNGLLMHEQKVGLQQVSRVLEIVEEVWRSDDGRDEKCDWIVLVAAKGLQTLYG